MDIGKTKLIYRIKLIFSFYYCRFPGTMTAVVTFNFERSVYMCRVIVFRAENDGDENTALRGDG